MKKLSWTQRKAIYYGIQAGKSNAKIAREIGVHRSTIGREIRRNAESREKYHPIEASDRSWERQEEAMPKRRLFFYGGVKYFSKLNCHNRIYYYVSKTHRSCCLNEFYGLSSEWQCGYLRPHEKKQFIADSSYKRFRLPETKDFLVQTGLRFSVTSHDYSYGDSVSLRSKDTYKISGSIVNKKRSVLIDLEDRKGGQTCDVADNRLIGFGAREIIGNKTNNGGRIYHPSTRRRGTEGEVEETQIRSKSDFERFKLLNVFVLLLLLRAARGRRVVRLAPGVTRLEPSDCASFFVTSNCASFLVTNECVSFLCD